MGHGGRLRRGDQRLLLSVLVERREGHSGPWSAPRWELIEVLVAGEQAARTCVHRDRERTRWLWTGLALELHRDACEGYWFNLTSAEPRLFVICFTGEEAGEGEELEPVLVSASQDEAMAHMESEDEVLSAPMPGCVREHLARFVAEHYVPQGKTKRKRDKWKEEGRREPRIATRGRAGRG